MKFIVHLFKIKNNKFYKLFQKCQLTLCSWDYYYYFFKKKFFQNLI